MLKLWFRVFVRDANSPEEDRQNLAKKILSKIKTTLSETPYDGKKLIGNLSDFYRLRVGLSYRLSIHEEIVTVEVVKVRHRKDVYR